jgi:cytochrome c biogenesis protein CcmG/thiol:disulfide interchange protein DsbE
MKKKLLFIIPIVVFALLAFLFWKGLGNNPQQLPSALVNKITPQFTATDLMTGNPVSSAVLKGQVSIVNVWATWCIPCRQEHDELLAIKQHYPIVIYGINYKDDVNEARKWLTEKSNPYVITWEDPTGKLGIEWGVTGVPETFLVDQHGVVRYRYAGPITMKIFQQQMLPLIASLYSEQ